MRVGVEKTVVHDLFDVVVRQLGGDFRPVVSGAVERLQIVGRKSVDVFHRQHMPRGERAVNLRAGSKGHALVALVKFFRVGGFPQKIHLLL